MLKPLNKGDTRKKQVVIALGSNLALGGSEPSEVLSNAIVALEKDLGDQLFVTAIFRSPAMPEGAGPDYANAVARVATDLAPQDLLARLHKIEADFERARDTRWGARTLDLDLIAVGSDILPNVRTVRRWIDLPLADQQRVAPDELILPHPRLQDRAFVLVPMAELLPDWRHPVLGLTVREMLAALPAADRAALTPLS